MGLFRKLILLVLMMVLLLPATAWAQDISAEMHHLLLRLNEDGSLQVREQVVLTNSGDAAQENFSISLPEGLEKLEFLEGIDESKVKVENGMLVIGEPAASGQATYALQYILPPGEAPHFLITKKFTVPTREFYVMTEQGALEVVSDQLKDAGPFAMGEAALQLYQAANLVNGSEIQIAVQQGAGSAPASPTQESINAQDPALERFMNQLPFKGVTAILFLVLLLLLPILGVSHYLGRRKSGQKSKPDVQDAEEDTFQRLMVKEKTLKTKLVELEQNYADKKISDGEYRAMQEVYKKKLLGVRAELKGYIE